MRRFLDKLRKQVEQVQTVQPAPVLPKPDIMVCTVSKKHIRPSDDYVRDNRGRYYLVAEIASESFLKNRN